jgi:hypothetical protein
MFGGRGVKCASGVNRQLPAAGLGEGWNWTGVRRPHCRTTREVEKSLPCVSSPDVHIRMDVDMAMGQGFDVTHPHIDNSKPWPSGYRRVSDL